jgi:hypothetical protein
MVQTDPSKSSWEAVRAMIKKATRLELISTISVSGFIFRLDIDHDPTLSEFFGLNDERTAFTKPVYSIVLKFVFLADKTRSVMFQFLNEKREPKNVSKMTEKASNFTLEAKHQQMIYQETLLPQGRPVTLAVVDVSKFDALNTRELINELEQVPTSSRMVGFVLHYMKTTVNDHVHLGLISMELANQSFSTLQTVKKELPKPLYDDACAYALAQIALLFVKLKVVLFDCHEANVLVNTEIETSPDQDKSILIDFGRMFLLNNFFRSFHPDKIASVEKDFLQLSGKPFRDSMRSIMDLEVSSINETNLLDVLHNLAFLDCAIAVPRKVRTNAAEAPVEIKRPQMLALLRYLHPELEGREDNWLNNPTLLQKVEPAKVVKILGMFREMVAASEAKESSLLEAKSQLYRVPDTIQDQVLIAPVTSPLRSETPRVKTPPTVVLSETDETQQPRTTLARCARTVDYEARSL